MNTFEKNTICLYKEKGRAWLASLPHLVQEAAVLWGLDRLQPLGNLSYNYVVAGYRQGEPIVLKLGLDLPALKKEAEALAAFAGYGAVAVLEQMDGLLLLERARPGTSLKLSSQNAIKVACDVAKKLHLAPLPIEHRFPSITEWLSTLDREWAIPKPLLTQARELKRQLLQTTVGTPVLLHGDLHRDNILANAEGWCVIDPKGVIGYPINEVWALVEDPISDLQYISHAFGFPLETVVNWYFVHLILAACWQVEDNLDPRLFLDLAQVAQSMMSA